MADLTTYEQVQAELADTSDFDTANDAAKAKRRLAALRRRLDFAQETQRDGQNAKFDLDHIRSQMDEIKQWLQENDTANSLDNSNVVHADFSQFGPYRD